MMRFLPIAIAVLRLRASLPCVMACGVLVSGCASTGTHVFREFSTGITAEDAVAILVWRYQDSSPGSADDRSEVEIERSLFECIKEASPSPGFNLRHISPAAFRHSELWDRKNDQLPGSTDEMLELLVGESAAGNATLVRVRYVVLLQVNREEAKAGGVSRDGVSFGVRRTVMMDAAVVDVIERRISGMLHTRSSGQRGAAFIPPMMGLPLPMYANPDGAACEDMGEELTRFLTKDPQD